MPDQQLPPAFDRFARRLRELAERQGLEHDVEPTLEDALAAAKADLVFRAIRGDIDDDDTAYSLAAQAFAVATLQAMVPMVALSPPPAERGVILAARELVAVVKGGTLEAGHFVGVFDELLGPLENLGDALAALDGQR